MASAFTIWVSENGFNFDSFILKGPQRLHESNNRVASAQFSGHWKSSIKSILSSPQGSIAGQGNIGTCFVMAMNFHSGDKYTTD
jgi:hypothetical protein